MSTDPASVMLELERIDRDMAERQNRYERAAHDWVAASREQKRARAAAFMRAEGTVADRNAIADLETATFGLEQEAAFVALKAVMQTLAERASVNQSILRAQQVR